MGRPHLRHGEKPPHKTLEEVSCPSEEQTGHLLGYSRRVCLYGPGASSPIAEQNSPLSPQVIKGGKKNRQPHCFNHTRLAGRPAPLPRSRSQPQSARSQACTCDERILSSND